MNGSEFFPYLIFIEKRGIIEISIDAEVIVGLLGHGWTEAEILENYPYIVQEDIRACLAYASAVLHTQKDYQHPMKIV